MGFGARIENKPSKLGFSGTLMNAFFPDPYFAWAFYGVLVFFTVAACYTDLRWIVVPKGISVAALATGVIFNVVRGAWLGMEGSEAWKFGANGGFVGALDGLTFSLAGFALGFLLFFLLWIIGACGGGDVKIFAAIGAWVGPYHSLWLLAGSTLVLIAFATLRLMLIFLTRGPRAIHQYSSKDAQVKDGVKRPYKRLLAYSLPLAIATALMMLWFYRYELQIATPTQGRGLQAQGVRSHG